MTEDEFTAYQSLNEETEDHRWAFGTGFTDPLEGIDASVPNGIDAAALTAYCLALGEGGRVHPWRDGFTEPRQGVGKTRAEGPAVIVFRDIGQGQVGVELALVVAHMCGTSSGIS